MPRLSQYDYIFGVGTVFSLLEAYNNGANDVANAWATSVSSRSVTYRQAMILCVIFELTGALAVGARTASTIKNGIIPVDSFEGNAGVQLLAFACAAAGASTWVMWCTRHSAHVSSTYSLISSLAGVGVATVGASKVQWGWNKGSGLGAIFAGLFMAPVISGAFGAIIFMLIKLTVHLRENPVPWAVWTSPFFFLIAGTICTLSIVYKGSPRLGLTKKPAGWLAGVSVGSGAALALLAAIFFVPYVYCKVIKKDYTLKAYHVFLGPLLFWRQAPEDAVDAKVPDYTVVQHTSEIVRPGDVSDEDDLEKNEKNDKAAPLGVATAPAGEIDQAGYQQLVKEAEERHHATLRASRGPLGWAMRYLHEHPIGNGAIHERQNIIRFISRIPAIIVVCLLYGANYDIHTAQFGIEGTPEGKRMEQVYSYAPKYKNEVEFLYSFVQIITACTASFAHGANDVGNAVGVWAVMYACWNTGAPVGKQADVDLWQIAVVALTICIGFITYGYNIMKVMGNKITYHSPSRGTSMELGASITVLVFSQYKLPVSTSMCITGATVGVGLCNGTWRAVNWQRIFLLVISWIFTIPVAGLIGGCLMGFLLNTPHFGMV